MYILQNWASFNKTSEKHPFLVKLETKKMKNEIDVKINDKEMNINLKS